MRKSSNLVFSPTSFREKLWARSSTLGYTDSATVKIFNLAATVSEFNFMEMLKNLKLSINKDFFLEDKTHIFEEWKNISRFCSATSKYFIYSWDWPVTWIHNWNTYGTADTSFSDQLHKAVNETLGISLNTNNMPAPEILFSFKRCSIWRKRNDFKKHIPFTKDAGKRNIVTEEDMDNLWKIRPAFVQV